MSERVPSCLVCGKKHCYWCGKPFGGSRHLNASKDHFPALANRGETYTRRQRANAPGFVWAHKICNNLRGNDDDWEAFHKRARRLKEEG